VSNDVGIGGGRRARRAAAGDAEQGSAERDRGEGTTRPPTSFGGLRDLLERAARLRLLPSLRLPAGFLDVLMPLLASRCATCPACPAGPRRTPISF
jgi:hypothetical protein